MTINWSAWDFDWLTIWIVLWIVQFALIEWFGAGKGEMVTDHLRPIFHAAPLTWWIAFGVWMWLGPHMLWPSAESHIAKVMGG